MSWLFGKKKKPQLRSRIPETRRDKLLKLAQSDIYYSVMITKCGCKASAKFIGKGFLFENAPPLPLKECTVGQCTCEYLGVINQRKKKRRASMRRVSIRIDGERRSSSRRKDEELWSAYEI